MRSSRLLAASTLLALSLGATVGTATAGAVAVSPSPTATSSATPTPTGTQTPTGTKSATPTATGSPSASPTGTPSATATAKPTARPTVPVPTPTPSGAGCRGYRTLELKTTGSGLANTTLVKGGAAGELSVTFENTASVDLQKVNTYFFLTDVVEAPVGNPVTWGADAFTIQVKLPGGDWKTPEAGTVNAGGPYLMVDLGVHKLAKGAKLAFQVRVTPTDKALTGDYYAQLDADSETFQPKDVPGAPATDSCIDFNGSFRVDGLFKVADKNAATTTAGAPASPSGSSSAKAGPQLAQTGSSSNTLPIALGGAAVLAAGVGTLLVLRRRKAGSHS
ncbi:LPXTG cell wall anchor domain-containing protein [Kitasatospora sp. RG8]|uniref:LAETG motif-containing sortase-dependent surface protein n=1 Tax=Kitasatospora sp. RG8 TaxID=2820815 RepID=UPI001ADEDA20|nr:LAETG motif-containing sortase-dependent surface protein [Kitasatospora sp. RG8]MBP0452008.1 LPXTG cell wall anchor domain-containing protein [Kitasatospora sp. RG8]